MRVRVLNFQNASMQVRVRGTSTESLKCEYATLMRVRVRVLNSSLRLHMRVCEYEYKN